MTSRTGVWAGPLEGRSRAPPCGGGELLRAGVGSSSVQGVLLRAEGRLFCEGGSPVRPAGGVYVQSSWGAAPLCPHSSSDSEPGTV